MELKDIFSIIITLFITITLILILLVYALFPQTSVEFIKNNQNPNFNLNQSEKKELQFYPNMRFPEKNISYKIYDCSLEKKYRTERAFEILENRTNLNFYQKISDEELSVFCKEENRIEGNLFIVGEGGPTRILKLEDYNLILKGEILLLKESKCSDPVVALHELLHVLGFVHSENKYNIMYNTSNCNQVLGAEIIQKINQLYSIPSYPDLKLEECSVSKTGMYVDVEASIRNNGFKTAQNSTLIMYADNKILKEIELGELKPGTGRKITIKEFIGSNVFVDEIKIEIKTDYLELNKNNNILTFKAKK